MPLFGFLFLQQDEMCIWGKIQLNSIFTRMYVQISEEISPGIQLNSSLDKFVFNADTAFRRHTHPGHSTRIGDLKATDILVVFLKNSGFLLPARGPEYSSNLQQDLFRPAKI